MSTYLQICQAVAREVGASGTISTVVSPTANSEAERIINWVADADELIQTLWNDWKFLWSQKSITTVAGTVTYTLSDLSLDTTLARWDKESFVYKPATDDYQPITWLPYKLWREQERLGASGSIPQDVPTYVAIKPNNDIVFYPTPNDTGPITADYWAKPTRLSANADTSAIPSQYHRIITVRAKMMYGEHEDAPEVYASANTEYTRYLSLLEADQLPDAEFKRMSQSDQDLVMTVGDSLTDEYGHRHREY